MGASILLTLGDGSDSIVVGRYSAAGANCALPVDERPEYLNSLIVEGNVKFLEFDPGSGLTLAVRLMHASRTVLPGLPGQDSGERLSNT